MNTETKLQPKDAYKVGEIYEFKVKRPYATYCELIDESNDITTYLQGTAKLKLFKGQSVKCRVTAVSEKHPKIELVDISEFEQSTDNLTEEKLSRLLSERDLSWNTKDFVKLLLTEEKEKSFESQSHRWIQSLLNKKIDLKVVRRECSDLLELSDLLNLCSPAEREFYQDRLTLLIEQLGYYIRAAELIENEGIEGSTDTTMLFIDNLFNKLKVSGFVYHPGKNFNILSSLFLRRPDLMNSRIKELLDIIKGKDINIWEKEPFKSALIKLLELYIRECDGRIDKTKDNQELIMNNMVALAIQLLLLENSKDTSIADYRLNTARLCTISSYLHNISPVHLVDMAYYCLFHSVGKRIAYGFDSIGMIPHYVASMYPCGKIDTVNSFVQNNTKLLISSDGISLQPLKGGANTYPVFPKELSLWQGLQVYLNSKPETSLSSVKANDIRPYLEVWKEIEGELFNTQVKKPTVTSVKKKKQHRIDEYVNITFVSQDLNDKNKYYCQIEDEIGGQGFIYVEDIVPYPISTSLRHFFANDGSRFVFEAQIIDREDDYFHFSMLEIIKDAVDGYYSYDEEIICSVGSVPNAHGEAPAISKEGVSVTLRNASEFVGIGKNNIVSCHLIGKAAGQFHIQCDINELTSYDYDLNSAFKILMEDMSIGRIPEAFEDQEDEQILETDKVIDESYVREVIYFIDRIAILDKDYIKAYNYLAFARVLCMLIGWESQAAYYQGRMDIITMLHEFAKNEKVDEERLSNLENANSELFSNNVLMRERFMQLQTVSYLGNPSHNDDLYKLASDNPWLKNLALLCLAYNITQQDGMEKTAVNIHNRIKQQLNLKGFESGLKQYGTGEEGIDEEYKSSIVFPTDEQSKGPNQEKQMNEIMKVINSFLNTVGGTLYIGVNNFGLGVGVEEDLNTPLYYGDKDKYLLTISNAVSLKWGNKIATYIESIAFDADNKDKDVVVVKIKPLAQGVDYDGYWYVRVGSTKRKLTKEDFEEYQKFNRNLSQIKVNDLPEEVVPVQPEQSVERPLATQLVTSKDDEIKTSRIRKNVLAEWDDSDNYVEPIGFFKFLSNGKFKKIDTYDYDTDSLLTLVVKESEEKGYLILGYENGCIVKVSVEELLEYQNRDYSRNTESKLIFASLANDDAAVLTISKEDKTKPKTLMRLDRVSNFKEGRLMDSGELPYNEGLLSEVLAFDVIPSEYIEDFKGILERPKTSLGYPENNVTRGMVNKLRLWGITEI